jgi:hypothetical protein
MQILRIRIPITGEKNDQGSGQRNVMEERIFQRQTKSVVFFAYSCAQIIFMYLT